MRFKLTINDKTRRSPVSRSGTPSLSTTTKKAKVRKVKRKSDPPEEDPTIPIYEVEDIESFLDDDERSLEKIRPGEL